MSAKQTSQKKLKKAKKYLGQTGYTLHASRLRYTGEGTMRSIKFPLHHSDSDTFNTFCEAIISDYKLVQGATNLESYLVDESSYSLIDFWTDSLRAGVIFQPSDAQLGSFLTHHYSLHDMHYQAFSNMKQSLSDKLDYELFKKKIMLSTGLRSNAKVTGILQCFKPELQKEAEVIQLANQIYEALVPDGSALTQVEQREYWLSQWRLYIPSQSTTNSPTAFYILPELEFNPAQSLKKCLDQRREHFSESMTSILGFDNNFSAFSNYYGEVVQSHRTENFVKIEQTILSLAPAWRGREVELRDRLQFLSDRSKLLPVSQLAKYADYRTSFGGKLQGWYSNYEAQLKRIGDQIVTFGEAIEKALKEVSEAEVGHTSEPLRETHEQRRAALIESMNQLYGLQRQLTETTLRDYSTLELFRDLLSYVRTDLNWMYQNYLQTAKEKKEEKTVESRYRGLFARLKLVPEFFGESRKKQFAKYQEQVVPIVRDGAAIIERLRTKLSDSADFGFVDQVFFARQLQKLLDKLHTQAWNTSTYRLLAETIASQYANGAVPSKNQAFYLSPYARNKNCKTIELSSTNDWGSELQGVIDLLSHSYQLHQNTSELLDWLEVQKWIVAWLLQANPDCELDTSDWPTTHFAKALAFQQKLGTKLTGSSKSYFVNSLLFSEMRGAASLLSRKELTMRYVVQPIASNSKFPIVLKSSIDTIDTASVRNLATTAHRWYIATQKPLSKSQITEESTRGLAAADNAGKKFVDLKLEYYEPLSLFEVRSSKYQIQFLDRLIYPGRKWNNLVLTASDSSLIVEDTYRVAWDLENCKPLITKMADARRLFISIPFTVDSKLDSDEKKLLREEIKSGRKRYLGVDVGEYGLAWVVLDFANPKQPKRVQQGFIFNESLRKIKDRAEEIKDTQVTGTFMVPSTKLARVRENAITALRNHVHDLVVRYNAKPIYEYSISNFETGSNKTTKIYRSVKVSDVVAENDSDNAVKAHVWGSKYIVMGNHISAYATSYTCSKCHRSIYDQGLDSQGTVEQNMVIGSDGRVIRIRLINNAEVCGYVNSKQGEITTPYQIGNLLSDKVVYGLAKNFARPPLEKSEALAFVESKNSIHLNNDRLREFSMTRGNSSVFVCPFTDCLHLSDADIQAAQNIALRGYLKDQEDKQTRNARERNKEQFDYMKAVRDYVTSNKLPTVELATE